MLPIFITGIGTDVGKTVVSAIVTEALQAAYWKPVQAGYSGGTDSEWVAERLSHPHGRILPETYRLALPASPHIAARQEGVKINLDRIVTGLLPSPSSASSRLPAPAPVFPDEPTPGPISLGESTPGSASPEQPTPDFLVIEGAGGLMVPLNEDEFVIDLIKRLDATVLLVSRNYLGSINHSLLTAAVCKAHGLKVAGWIFNDQYQHYEAEIVRWSGIPFIASIPHHENPDSEFVRRQAAKMKNFLLAALTQEA